MIQSNPKIYGCYKNDKQRFAAWFISNVLQCPIKNVIIVDDKTGGNSYVIDDEGRNLYVIKSKFVVDGEIKSNELVETMSMWTTKPIMTTIEKDDDRYRLSSKVIDVISMGYNVSFIFVTTARISYATQILVNAFAKDFEQLTCSFKYTNPTMIAMDGDELYDWYKKEYDINFIHEYANSAVSPKERTGSALMTIMYYAVLACAMFFSSILYFSNVVRNSGIEFISLTALLLFNVASWFSSFAKVLREIGLIPASIGLSKEVAVTLLLSKLRKVIIYGHLLTVFFYLFVALLLPMIFDIENQYPIRIQCIDSGQYFDIPESGLSGLIYRLSNNNRILWIPLLILTMMNFAWQFAQVVIKWLDLKRILSKSTQTEHKYSENDDYKDEYKARKQGARSGRSGARSDVETDPASSGPDYGGERNEPGAETPAAE